jgi:ATP-dependent RNA helicase DeaD
MAVDFKTLGVKKELIKGLDDLGVTIPTPIQREAVPLLISGKDVLAQAQTGTGKTFAFILPILERVNTDKPYIQGLIITPTRELALQITTELNKLAYIVGAKVLAAYGGQDVERQIKKLKGTIHIVVGTPGRILDHLRRETISLKEVKMLVLDEADQMLHMGFLPDVENIIKETSPKRQTMLFSATIPENVQKLAKRYMSSPVKIKIESERVTLDEIKQNIVETSDRGKQVTLFKLLDKYRPFLALIFCRTKRRTAALNKALIANDYLSDELHGDLSQAKREQVMKRFREAKIQFLVATDVAARGLDIEGITHVFNYDVPQDVESYIHRIGRTGRAGEKGHAITLITPKDRFDLKLIEQGIGMSVESIGGDLIEAGRTAQAKGYQGKRGYKDIKDKEANINKDNITAIKKHGRNENRRSKAKNLKDNNVKKDRQPKGQNNEKPYKQNRSINKKSKENNTTKRN